MLQIFNLVKRNVRIYLRDPIAVFSSLVPIFVLLLIYILFLGNVNDPVVKGYLGNNSNQISFAVYSQMMAGVIVLNTITIPLGYLGGMVSDFQNRHIDACMVSPLKRYKIILGYYLSSLVVTLFFSLVMWLLASIAIGLVTGIFYSFQMILYVSLWIIIFVFINTSFMILFATFIKSINAFGPISGIVGGFVGFVSGIYLPINQNSPDVLRNFSSLIPFSHMSTHLKNILLQPTYDNLVAFDQREAIAAVRDYFGASELGFAGFNVQSGWIIFVTALLAVLIFFLTTIRLSKKIKR